MMGTFLLLTGLAAALAGPTLAPISSAERPVRMSGIGLNVADLERSKTFYTEVLGLKVAARLPAQGPAKEYLLNLSGDLRADTLIVLREGRAEPGATSFGRLVLAVPDGGALAKRVETAGYGAPRVIHGMNFITDPDGYSIELYQRPSAPARP